MCLTTKTDARPLIASEDIVCYKFLYKAADFYENHKSRLGKLFMADVKAMVDEGHQFFSPFRSAPYSLGKRYEAKLDEPLPKMYVQEWTIDRGLHTFIIEEQARNEAKYNDDGDGDCIVVKCRIPAGASYYKGKFHSACGWSDSYASDALILDEVI